MLDIMKIFGLTILGLVALGMLILFGVAVLIIIWPFVLFALSITLIIYIIYLIKMAKPKTSKRDK